MNRYRKYIRYIRNRLEGVLFFISCLFLGVWTGSTRQRHLARSGFHDLRVAWWTLFQLERYRDIWRYVLLIEWFAAKRRTKKKEPGTVSRENKRILVIKLGHFGDTLHTVPLLRGLKQGVPNCEIDLLVGPWTVDLAHRIPYVDQVHVYAPHMRYFHRGNVSRCRNIWAELKWVHTMQKRAYDVVVVSYTTDLIELFLLSAMNPKVWVGPASECALYRDLGQQREAAFERDVYEAERLAHLGRLLRVDIENTHLEFPVRKEEADRATELLRVHGVRPNDRWVVMCPGAGWPGKQWPPERFAEVADCLIEDAGCCIVLCGSRGEVLLGNTVVAAMNHEAINLVGRTGWGELAALVRDAELFIGNDSGPMHLTAVYGTSSVLLFGPTSITQWAPRHDAVRLLRHVSSCPDCWSWHPGRDCVYNRDCMKKITVAEVCEAAKSLLETSPLSCKTKKAT